MEEGHQGRVPEKRARRNWCSYLTLFVKLWRKGDPERPVLIPMNRERVLLSLPVGECHGTGAVEDCARCLTYSGAVPDGIARGRTKAVRHRARRCGFPNPHRVVEYRSRGKLRPV